MLSRTNCVWAWGGSIVLTCLVGGVKGADFDGDGLADLAIGVPGENVGDISNAGLVNILYGDALEDGLTAEGSQCWSQDSHEMKDDAEDGDGFGHALAAGDFNGDGCDDLAIGVPGKDVIDFLDHAGAVGVVHGSEDLLSSASAVQWTQESAGVNGAADHLDNFGTAVATGYFNDDSFADLAIGVPTESLLVGEATVLFAGAVNVIYGTDDGLAADGQPVWTQGPIECAGIEPDDRFGFALGSGGGR